VTPTAFMMMIVCIKAISLTHLSSANVFLRRTFINTRKS